MILPDGNIDWSSNSTWVRLRTHRDVVKHVKIINLWILLKWECKRDQIATLSYLRDFQYYWMQHKKSITWFLDILLYKSLNDRKLASQKICDLWSPLSGLHPISKVAVVGVVSSLTCCWKAKSTIGLNKMILPDGIIDWSSNSTWVRLRTHRDVVKIDKYLWSPRSHPTPKVAEVSQ